VRRRRGRFFPYNPKIDIIFKLFKIITCGSGEKMINHSLGETIL
jgi:hypothetical protein